MSRTLIARADRRRLELAVTVLTEIVRRMAEIAADAVEGRVVVGAIADAAGAVDVLVVADGIVADAAGRAGEGTNFFATDFADLHGYEKGHGHVSWPFICLSLSTGIYISRRTQTVTHGTLCSAAGCVVW